MRVVFLGTPEFALPSLEALADSSYEIAAVITQPDRPAGRGQKASPPAVKTRALATFHWFLPAACCFQPHR